MPDLPTDPPAGAPADDPPPLPPREPQLEDCCGTGCVHCVFDMYEIALEQYAVALRAWEARRASGAG
jgi:hypothetical protein